MKRMVSRRVRRVFFVLAAGGILVAWMAWRSRPPQRLPRSPIMVSRPPNRVPVAEQSPAKPVPANASAPAGGTNPAPILTEICGHGRVAVNFADREAQTKYNASLVGLKEADWIGRMQNSDDLRARAAGLLLDGREYGDGLLNPASERARTDLVQLALGTADPVVYGLAVRMCSAYQWGRKLEACQQISAHRWTELDPGNAAPWIMMADEADTRHDEASAATALEHASHAAAWRVYNGELVGFTDSLLPSDLPAYDRMVLESDIATYGSNLSGVSGDAWGLIEAHCDLPLLQDADRAATCSSLADLLVEKGRTVMAFGVGLRLGERVGWPTGRLDALRQELAAMHSKYLATGLDALTCEGLKRREPVVEAAIEGGELGLIRAAMRLSGISISELAEHTVTPVDTLLDQFESSAKFSRQAQIQLRRRLQAQQQFGGRFSDVPSEN